MKSSWTVDTANVCSQCCVQPPAVDKVGSRTSLMCACNSATQPFYTVVLLRQVGCGTQASREAWRPFVKIATQVDSDVDHMCKQVKRLTYDQV